MANSIPLLNSTQSAADAPDDLVTNDLRRTRTEPATITELEEEFTDEVRYSKCCSKTMLALTYYSAHAMSLLVALYTVISSTMTSSRHLPSLPPQLLAHPAFLAYLHLASMGRILAVAVAQKLAIFQSRCYLHSSPPLHPSKRKASLAAPWMQAQYPRKRRKTSRTRRWKRP